MLIWLQDAEHVRATNEDKAIRLKWEVELKVDLTSSETVLAAH